MYAASPDSMQPVEALLAVVAYPDPSISALSFNFWHRLMRHLITGFSDSQQQQQNQNQQQTGSHNAHASVSLYCVDNRLSI